MSLSPRQYVSTDIHAYDTIDNGTDTTTTHRLDIAATLHINIEPKLFNILTERIKLEESLKTFKILLKNLLEGAFYSVKEFLVS